MASDSLSKSNPQTGTTDVPTVKTGQVENLPRPGGREHGPGGFAESPDVPGESARPGGQEGGMAGKGSDDNMFARPGGAETWRK